MVFNLEVFFESLERFVSMLKGILIASIYPKINVHLSPALSRCHVAIARHARRLVEILPIKKFE